MAKKAKKPRKNPAVEKLAKEGSGLMQAGSYSKGLGLFKKALALDPDHIYSLYGAAYCQACMANAATGAASRKLKDRVLDLSRKLIRLSPLHTLWPFVGEHDFLRETLRFSYNALAWYAMERAKKPADLEKALADADRGLQCLGGAEDASRLLQLWDTKVRILLKLKKTDEAYEIVQRFPKHHDFADLVKSEAYLKWRKKGGANDLLKPGKGETAIDALKRLQASIAKYGHETYGALVFSKPVPMSEVRSVEKQIGGKLPPSYVQLVTKHGVCKLLWEAPAKGKDYEKLDGCRAILSPSDMVDATDNIRDGYRDDEEFADTLELLEDSLAFQQNHYDDNFYTFRISDGAKARGEMSVHAYYHDDAYEFSGKRRGFDEHVRDWVQGVIEER